MTDLNTFLATEVLELVPGKTEYQWLDKNGSYIFDGRLFTPDTDIAQAMMCLGAFAEASIAMNKPRQGYCCSVRHRGKDKWNNSGWQESLPMAISLACAKAKGFNNDS